MPQTIAARPHKAAAEAVRHAVATEAAKTTHDAAAAARLVAAWIRNTIEAAAAARLARRPAPDAVCIARAAGRLARVAMRRAAWRATDPQDTHRAWQAAEDLACAVAEAADEAYA